MGCTSLSKLELLRSQPTGRKREPVGWTTETTPAALGRRWADALIGVTGRDGQEDWVLVHVEVQGVGKPDFAQRMFVYNYRLYDRHGRPVVSLAVLGEPASGAFGEFGYQRWGCRMGLRFPVVSLSDWRARWAELDASANPFAVVTQAHLKAQETAGSDAARYRAKLTLIRSLYRRGYQRADILELLRFIDWVLTLPEGLEHQLWTEVQQFDEEKRMRYVSSWMLGGSRGGRMRIVDLVGRNRAPCAKDRTGAESHGARRAARYQGPGPAVACRIHQGSRDAAQFWNCWVRLRAGRPIVCDLSSAPCPHFVLRLAQPAGNLLKPRLQVQSSRRPDRPRTIIKRTSHVDLAIIQPPSRRQEQRQRIHRKRGEGSFQRADRTRVVALGMTQMPDIHQEFLTAGRQTWPAPPPRLASAPAVQAPARDSPGPGPDRWASASRSYRISGGCYTL